MRKENLSPFFIELSNLEKFVLNTFFLMILGYIYLVGHFHNFLVMNNLRVLSSWGPFVLIFLFFISRIATHFKKNILAKTGETWIYKHKFKKAEFEASDITAIKKSFLGLYSSVVFTLNSGKKIRVPAEHLAFEKLILDLAQHLPKEQIENLLEFGNTAKSVEKRVEKPSRFLRFACFFIVPISFFTVHYVWGFFSAVIIILWVFLSMIYPFIWTIIHWALLRISAKNARISSRISALWIIWGLIFYMFFGIAYRQFFLWIIFR